MATEFLLKEDDFHLLFETGERIILTDEGARLDVVGTEILVSNLSAALTLAWGASSATTTGGVSNAETMAGVLGASALQAGISNTESTRG